MRRHLFFRALLAAVMGGGAAWAQHGLIVEPWNEVHPPAVSKMPPLQALPASGLDPATVSLAPPRPVAPTLPAHVSPPPWSPPVVELLVDPWAKGQVAGATNRLRWEPIRVEIVDPWANRAPHAPPRVASRAAGVPQSPIF